MSAPAIKAPDFSGKRVLLAEDNEFNREIALAVLEGRGLKVEWAANGREACDLLKLKRADYFDLVLMDIQMPVMDGYAATRKIRSLDDPALARIPIIAMTANAFAEDRDQALAAGMDGHLAKPLDIEALDAELRKFLG